MENTTFNKYVLVAIIALSFIFLFHMVSDYSNRLKQDSVINDILESNVASESEISVLFKNDKEIVQSLEKSVEINRLIIDRLPPE